MPARLGAVAVASTGNSGRQGILILVGVHGNNLPVRGIALELPRGLAIDQFSDLLHYYLAMTYEKKDMVFHAIDHYEKAIELNPGFYDAITSLANLYQKQEFWRKAVEMWELALSATKDETVRARIKDHLLSLL